MRIKKILLFLFSLSILTLGVLPNNSYAQGPGSFPTTGIFKIYGTDTRTGGTLSGASVYWSKSGVSGSGYLSSGFFSRNLNAGTYSYTVSNYKCSPSAIHGSTTITSNRISTVYVSMWCPNPNPPTKAPTKPPVQYTNLTVCTYKTGNIPIKSDIKIKDASTVNTGNDGCNSYKFVRNKTLIITADPVDFFPKTENVKLISENQRKNFYFSPPPTPTKTPPAATSFSVCFNKSTGGRIAGQIEYTRGKTTTRYDVPVNCLGGFLVRTGDKVILTSIVNGFVTQTKNITVTKDMLPINFILKSNTTSPTTTEPRGTDWIIKGTVKDKLGAPIPEVVIKIQNGGVNDSTTTNAKGEYILNVWRAGSYIIQASKKDFTTSISPSMTLITAKPSATYNFTLVKLPSELPTKTPMTTTQPKPSERPAITGVPTTNSITHTPTTTLPTATYNPDFNNDGNINIADYTIFSCELIGSGACNQTGTQKKSDANKDGNIDLIDFIIWRNARK